MTNRKFKVEFLKSALDDELIPGTEGIQVESKLIDNRRWYGVYACTFKSADDGKFYKFTYQCGRQENEETRPFDDMKDEDEVECIEVQPVRVSTMAYMTYDQHKKHLTDKIKALDMEQERLARLHHQPATV